MLAPGPPDALQGILTLEAIVQSLVPCGEDAQRPPVFPLVSVRGSATIETARTGAIFELGLLYSVRQQFLYQRRFLLSSGTFSLYNRTNCVGVSWRKARTGSSASLKASRAAFEASRTRSCQGTSLLSRRAGYFSNRASRAARYVRSSSTLSVSGRLSVATDLCYDPWSAWKMAMTAVYQRAAQERTSVTPTIAFSPISPRFHRQKDQKKPTTEETNMKMERTTWNI